jgi:hypothetical protein
MIKTAFRPFVVSLKLDQLLPSKELSKRDRQHPKYQQIASSIASVGLIEPLVVFPSGRKYRVLDGHKRLEILRSHKISEAPCLIATDDETYTYNKRVNYLSTVGEHQMILCALDHNSEEDVANALNVNIRTIREKRDLLNGICKEAIDVLKDRRVSPRTFSVLRKMRPIRQIQVAELMVASNRYSGVFAMALLMGTHEDLLVTHTRRVQVKADQTEQRLRLQHETEALLKSAKTIQDSYGRDALALTIACRYVAKILALPAVRDYIESKSPEILQELDMLLAAFHDEVAKKPASRSDGRRGVSVRRG